MYRLAIGLYTIPYCSKFILCINAIMSALSSAIRINNALTGSEVTGLWHRYSELEKHVSFGTRRLCK